MVVVAIRSGCRTVTEFQLATVKVPDVYVFFFIPSNKRSNTKFSHENRKIYLKSKTVRSYSKRSIQIQLIFLIGIFKIFKKHTFKTENTVFNNTYLGLQYKLFTAITGVLSDVNKKIFRVQCYALLTTVTFSIRGKIQKLCCRLLVPLMENLSLLLHFAVNRLPPQNSHIPPKFIHSNIH